MEILWLHGEVNVHSVIERLDADIAYTTVMTTLNRLHSKGLANRRMVRRAFQYTPSISRRDWERACIERFIGSYLADPQHFPMILSLLVEAAGASNPELLDELERKIGAKRLEMARDGLSLRG